MVVNNLGKMKRIELRKAWGHEASDFTNWLAEEENLRLLSDAIGVDIKLIQTEAPVGKFNVDILAEEEATGNKIIIENQLELTNHDHLGKTIVYASGFDANIILWIVKEAREEHRQAVDWLNEHTDEDLAFFLVRIELWQIEGSPFAPKFEIISKPNDWAKTIKQSMGNSKVTDVKARQLEFWNQFKTYAENHNTILHLSRKLRPQHWLSISIGNSSSHIELTLNSFDEVIRTELYVPDDKELYHFLEQRKDKIEKELGNNLVWMELPERKASRIRIELSGLVDNVDEWEKYFAWMQETAEKFYRVFSGVIRKYK